MKTVIFGQYNPFTLCLISRLKKEGHQTFVITGSESHTQHKPRDVFQEYNFQYDDNSITYVLNSIEPDVVIFTGTKDSNYDWDDTSHPTEYIGDIARVLNQCVGTSIRQFVYLSTLNVFEGYKSGKIKRSLMPKPLSEKNRAVYIGEKICTSYESEANFTIDIVRIGEVYGVHGNTYISGDICSALSKSILSEEPVNVNMFKPHYLLYVNDAVDYIYKVITVPGLESSIYHALSPTGTAIKEKDIVEVIEEASGKKANIKQQNTVSEKQKLPTYSDEEGTLEYFEKYDLKRGMSLLVDAIKKQTVVEERHSRRRFSVKKTFVDINKNAGNSIGAIVGNILFFICLQVLIILTRNFSFHAVIDIYLLYVAVMAVIYGYKHAILAVALSILGKVFLTMTFPSEFITIERYGFYLWIIEIFVIGVMIGYLKDRYRRQFEDYEEDKELLEEELKNIKRINYSNIEVKNLYERRILDYKDSFARIHQVVSKLDAIEPDLVIFKSVKVICELMDTEDVSIYMHSRNSPYYRLMAASSQNASVLGKSITITSFPMMFEKLKNQEIYINKSIDKNVPLLAGGTFSDGELETIIMIWSLPYGSNNLYTMNIFSVLCRLIEGTMSKAYNYMESLNEAYQKKYKNQLDRAGFAEALNRYKVAHEEGLAEYSVLELRPSADMAKEIFRDTVARMVRTTDYLYVDKDKDIASLLLTNTNESEVSAVISRFEEKDINVQPGE